MSYLPINLDDLINARSVESTRLEYKRSWSAPILHAVIRTICAFANDLQNLNGGYLIIGIEAPFGTPILPPAGLSPDQIEDIQQEIRGNSNRIEPVYVPALAPETYMDRHILVVWAAALYAKRQLNQEAIELLRRAIQLSQDDVRAAWCNYDLAGALLWLRAPATDVLQAISAALSILPNEAALLRRYEQTRLSLDP